MSRNNNRDHFGVGMLWLMLVCLLSNGCASMRAYETAQQQLERKEYDAAVASFREAHDLWPENQRYFEAWQRASERAIQWHKDEASRLFNERMLGPALAHADRALEYCDPQGKPLPGKGSGASRTACGLPKGPPHHPHTLRGAISVNEIELSDLRDVIDRAIREARERADTGEAQMQAETWDDAIATLRRATELDRSSERASKLLTEALNGAINNHLRMADERLRAEAWDSCRHECEIVLSYRPVEHEAQRLMKLADNRQRARELQAKAAQAIPQREYLAAVEALEQAIVLWPEDASINAALTESKNLAADALTAEARSRLASAQYNDAARLLDKANSLVPNRSDVVDALRETETAWADSLVEEASRHFREGRNELAWVHAARACGISTGHRAAQQAFERYGTSIQDELRCAIAIVPVSPSGTEASETLRACAMITGALKAQSPAHLRIVERSNLSGLLMEHDLARTDLLDPAALSRIASRLSNADLLLFVSTTTRSNDAQDVERWDSVTYVAGTKLESNPAYAQAQAAVNQAHREMGDAQLGSLALGMLGGLAGQTGKLGAQALGAGARGVGSIGASQAEQKYNAAVMQLNQTPPLIEVPDERQYQFPVCRITRSATVTAEMRLVDVATGEVVWTANDVAHTVAQSDTYVRPEPQYGVPGKQAVLSTAEQLCAEACEQMQPQFQEATRSLLCQRADAYLARARRASDPDSATAHRVHYLFDPGPRPSPGAVEEVLDSVFESDPSDVRADRVRTFVLERLDLSLSSSAADDHAQENELEPTVQASRQPAAAQPASTPPPGPKEFRVLELFDKRKRDKQEAFGLVFDVDDVTEDGVDIRVSRPGSKGPKFEDCLQGRAFDALGVHVEIIECDIKNERAVIAVSKR